MKKTCSGVVVSAVILALAACGSSDSSSSESVFPSTITPDMASVSSAGAATILSNIAVKSIGAKALGDGDLSAPISASTNIAEMVHVVTDAVLAGVATGCNSVITAATTAVDCTATINATAIPIHISFAAFDYNGDGTNDGTGTASVSGTTPIAFRAWKTADGSRLACGLIYTLPTFSGSTLTNAGKGEIVIQPNSVITALNSNVYTKIAWDAVTSSTLRTYDVYITGTLPSTGSETPIITLMHGYLTEDSSSGSTVYSFKLCGTFDDSAQIGPPSDRFYAIQYASTWKDAGTNIGFINKSYQQDHVTETTGDFNNQAMCAVISTAQPASGGNPADYAVCTTEGLATVSSSEYMTPYNFTAADAVTYAQFPTAFTAGY